MTADPAYVVGVDVGGTFTDVFILDEATRPGRPPPRCRRPAATSRRLRGGHRRKLATSPRSRPLVHGTTVGTNALLERKGARTGMITTEGFRDVLEMRRRDRPTDLGPEGRASHRWWSAPTGVRGGGTHPGRRHVAADAVDEGPGAGRRDGPGRERGCDAVCVFFINGYANQRERAPGCGGRALGLAECLRHRGDRDPAEIREFERLSTATLNAYLQPVVSSYLDRLEHGPGRGTGLSRARC